MCTCTGELHFSTAIEDSVVIILPLLSFNLVTRYAVAWSWSSVKAAECSRHQSKQPWMKHHLVILFRQEGLQTLAWINIRQQEYTIYTYQVWPSTLPSMSSTTWCVLSLHSSYSIIIRSLRSNTMAGMGRSALDAILVQCNCSFLIKIRIVLERKLTRAGNWVFNHARGADRQVIRLLLHCMHNEGGRKANVHKGVVITRILNSTLILLELSNYLQVPQGWTWALLRNMITIWIYRV